MADLEVPPTPSYGPNTFSELAELARILYANDEKLDQQSSGGGGLTIEEGTIVWEEAPDYENIGGGMMPRLFKLGNLVVLTGGMRGRSTNVTAGTYYVVGQLPAGFHPAGPGSVFSSGLLQKSATEEPAIRTRVNTAGQLAFRCPVAMTLTVVAQLVIPTMVWPVAS